MRRSTLVRDVAGTIIVLVILLMITFGFILGEHWLENFKSH